MERVAYVDLDGVVYDWEGQARMMLSRNRGKELLPSTSWDGLESQVSKAEWDRLWNEQYHELFLSGMDIWGALEGVKDLAAHYKIHFLTKRPPRAKRVTEQWLNNYLHCPYELTILGRGPKSQIFEGNFSRGLNIITNDIFIDDKPENLVDMQAHVRSLFLYTQPWNKNSDAFKKMDRPVVRVSSWTDFLTKLDALTLL